MAVTKAQLVVWALISGLSVWGYTMLSRVKLADEGGARAEAVLATAVELPTPAEPSAPVAAATAMLPTTVSVFPFPDDLVPDVEVETPESELPTATESFAEIPVGAIPELSMIDGGGAATEGAVEVAAVAAPEPEAEIATKVVAESVVVAEQPPIPMPSRPVVAQPVKAVPLSEVKTLYVVADALNVRAAPSTNGPVLQKLPQGFAVAAREQANEWIGFLMRDGSTGWMRTDYLSDTMPSVPAVAASTGTWTEPLNLMM